MIFQLFEARILYFSCSKYIFNIQPNWKYSSQYKMCFKYVYPEHDKKILPHMAILFSPYTGNYVCAFGVEWFLPRPLVNVTVAYIGVSPCLLVEKPRASCRHQLCNKNLDFSASLKFISFPRTKEQIIFLLFQSVCLSILV